MRSSIGMCALGALWVWGCAGPRMVAPADVTKGSQILEVADRSSMSGSLVDESFKLGTFRIADVDRDWTSKSGLGVAGYSKDTTTTGYAYALKGGGATWTGICASKADKQGVAVLGGQVAWGKTSISCECKSGATTASLVLRGDSPDSSQGLSGELTAGGATYRVSLVTETDKSTLSGEPAGFRFDGDAGAVGAVEVLRPGRVWLHERLPEAERPPAVCLSAGLMLYQAPSDH